MDKDTIDVITRLNAEQNERFEKMIRKLAPAMVHFMKFILGALAIIFLLL